MTPSSRRAIAIAVIVLLPATGAYVVSKVRARAAEQARREAEASCRASLDALDGWLHDLERDGEVWSLLVPKPGDELALRERPLPTLPLVTLAQPAVPVTTTGALTLSPGRLGFLDDEVDIGDDAAVAALVGREDLRRRCPRFGTGRQGRSYFSQPVDLFIAESVPWGDVTRVVEALGRASYGPLELVFAVAGRASPPPESEALRRFVAIGTSQDERPWQRLAHAAQTLEDSHPHCARIANPVRATPSDSATPMASSARTSSPTRPDSHESVAASLSTSGR